MMPGGIAFVIEISRLTGVHDAIRDTCDVYIDSRRLCGGQAGRATSGGPSPGIF